MLITIIRYGLFLQKRNLYRTINSFTARVRDGLCKVTFNF